MGLSGLSPDQIAARVAESCAAQGLPVKVTDPLLVHRVVVLLGGPVAGPRAQPRSGSTRTDTGRSVAPHDHNTVRVETSATASTGSDHDVVDQRPDDGVLTVQIQTRPGTG